MSALEYRCQVPNCKENCIIPLGSDKPRCPVHEPEKLWTEAEAAWKKSQGQGSQ